MNHTALCDVTLSLDHILIGSIFSAAMAIVYGDHNGYLRDNHDGVQQCATTGVTPPN